MRVRIPLYGLADPHLGRSFDHSMAEFGEPWVGHPYTLFARWDETVPNDAIVLVPGDLSVAARRDDVVADYADLEVRTGALKVLSPGNHDWAVWDTQGKARKACAPYPSLLALKGQAERFALADGAPGMVLVATCGSLTPGSEYFDEKPDHAKRYAKETRRLGVGLALAAEMMRPGDALVVAIHYPPFHRLNETSAYTQMIEDAGAALCVFGHIHNPDEHRLAFQGERGGCTYRLIASDYLRMTPCCLGSLTAGGLELTPSAATVAA